MSLGYDVVPGICAVCGTIFCRVSRARSRPSPACAVGHATLAGIGVSVGGIMLSALADLGKERDLSEAAKKGIDHGIRFEKGPLVALFCGVMSACFAFGLDAAAPFAELSAGASTSVLWTGLPKFVVILLGGFTSNAIWCIALNLRTRTALQFVQLEFAEP